MRIVADKNIPFLTETFGMHGELVRLTGREICTADLTTADVLLVRSVTRVDQTLLKGTGVQFVGSATIGIDHLDADWLEANDIHWANAPGSNADSAAQYALAMMLLACNRSNVDFRQQRVGIIGRGNVGSRLEHLLKVLDIPVKACDPPLRERGELQLVSMDEVCSSSIISLHVPLTSTGKYPTRGMLDDKRMRQLCPGVLLVNTSRGAVIEKSGLQAHLESGRLRAALDVWPDEPFVSKDLLNAVTVSTPHVAGYSLEGKIAGTEMIYREFCRTFSPTTGTLPPHTFKPTRLQFSTLTPPAEVIEKSIQSSCPVARDDAALRAVPSLSNADTRIQIDRLRADYPERHEFKSHLVIGTSEVTARQLGRLGFRTA